MAVFATTRGRGVVGAGARGGRRSCAFPPASITSPAVDQFMLRGLYPCIPSELFWTKMVDVHSKTVAACMRAEEAEELLGHILVG